LPSEASCPFCLLDLGRILTSGPHVVAIWDAHPVSRGHSLVVPRRHLESIFELTADESAELWATIQGTRGRLLKDFAAEGFTVGINDGEVAGQTVPHAHVHVIPRYRGDAKDPRGGVRLLFPDRARYWGSEKT
jgi:diadenosine tetraphosphate (Ap4A) HIT family hydrolase